MTKLSDAQIKVLESVHTTGELPKGTRQTTLTKLREELGFLLITRIGEETNYTLTTEGREAIGVKVGEQVAEWEKELLAEMPEEKAAVIREEMEDEFTESDEPAVPFFNRKALRDLRRQQARYNRRMMREQGKRRRKYGADDPKYFRRRYLPMLADTSELAAA